MVLYSCRSELSHVVSMKWHGEQIDIEKRTRCSRYVPIEVLYFSRLCFFEKFFLVFWFCVHYKGEVNQKGVNCEAKKDRNCSPRGK